MKRQIKFRGKRKDNGVWIYGDLIIRYTESSGFTKTGPSINFMDKSSFVSYEVIPESVGQSTGLLDKSGIEIYEGDILNSINRIKKIVSWDRLESCFVFTEQFKDPVKTTFSEMKKKHGRNYANGVHLLYMFVIGNIIDDQDLLNP